jgi:hypothetical protein
MTPGRNCSPGHPSHIEPSSLELSRILELRLGKQYLLSPHCSPRHPTPCEPSVFGLSGILRRGEQYLPGRNRSPRQPTHCEPSSLELSRILRRGKQYLAGRTSAAASTVARRASVSTVRSIFRSSKPCLDPQQPMLLYSARLCSGPDRYCPCHVIGRTHRTVPHKGSRGVLPHRPRASRGLMASQARPSQHVVHDSDSTGVPTTRDTSL